MRRLSLQREVTRYISWPGQACAYKIGCFKFVEMRKRAEATLGPKFDLREFHDVVLNHFGPFSFTEKAVDDYIKSKA